MTLKKDVKKENSLDVKDDDDLVFDDDSNMSSFENSDKIKKLKEKLDKCISENKENLLGWQRARADFINAKKENEVKIKESFDFARIKLIEEILPVLDSFDMAFGNKETWESAPKNWRIGVEYIYSQILTILENNGLKKIDKTNLKFDPNIHIPIDTIDTNKETQDDIVIDIVQNGYEVKGKVLRPAKVKIGKYRYP